MKLSAEANESLAIRLLKNVLDVPRTSCFCFVYGCVNHANQDSDLRTEGFPMNKNKKLFFTSTAIGAISASHADAAIYTAMLNIDLDADGESVYIDVDTGAFSQSSFTDQDLQISFSDSEKASYHDQAWLGGTDGLTILESALDNNTADRFSYGDALVGTGDNSSDTEFPNGGTGDWAGFTGIAYAGFDKDGHKGWVELDYQPDDTSTEAGNILVRSFAYGSNGEITEAGVVPEPAHAAAICALLAGSATAFSRRRNRRA